MSANVENNQTAANQEKTNEETSSRYFFEINQNFIESTDFKNLTMEWFKTKKYDIRMKILKIKNCPNFEECIKKFFYVVDASVANNLFVLVMEFSENFEAPTELEIRQFWRFFRDGRPFILQLNSPDGKVKQIFVNSFKGDKLIDLATIENFKFSDHLKNYLEVPEFFKGDKPIDQAMVDKTKFTDIRCLKGLLEDHGWFDGDIETMKLSQIPDTSKWSETISKSVLLIRFINLFKGGCARIVWWLTAHRVLELKHLKTYFAFIDYPFYVTAAVNIAWDFQRYDLVEFFVTNHSPFPIHFDVNRMAPGVSEDFLNLLAQREQLHQSIEKGDKEEVSRILNEMEKRGQLKYAVSQSNSSAMATIFKNFNGDLYELLLQKNLQFCYNCVELMNSLPEETRIIVKNKNLEFAKSLKRVENEHTLLEKCFLATGHNDHDFYSKTINQQFWKLQEHPETSQLLLVAEKSCNLEFIFDFKQRSVKMMDPTDVESNTEGRLSGSTIFISGKHDELALRGTLAHEMTHLVMRLLYNNKSQPFLDTDFERKQEFDEVIAECKNVYEKKEKVATQIINETFLYNPEADFASELIARVPEILIQCSDNDIEAIKAKYPKLFTYYFQHVSVDINQYLNNKP